MTKSYTVPATGRVPTRKFWIEYDQWWTELASEEVSKREKLTWIEAFGKFGLWIIWFTFLEDTPANLSDPAIFQDSFHSWRRDFLGCAKKWCVVTFFDACVGQGCRVSDWKCVEQTEPLYTDLYPTKTKPRNQSNHANHPNQPGIPTILTMLKHISAHPYGPVILAKARLGCASKSTRPQKTWRSWIVSGLVSCIFSRIFFL